jgi:hypothetical protein
MDRFKIAIELAKYGYEIIDWKFDSDENEYPITKKSVIKDNPVPSLDNLSKEIEARGFTPKTSPKNMYYYKICMTESQIVKLFQDILENGVETDKEQPENKYTWQCSMCKNSYVCEMCASIG